MVFVRFTGLGVAALVAERVASTVASPRIAWVYELRTRIATNYLALLCDSSHGLGALDRGGLLGVADSY
jgi:hypothetical protein